MREPLSGPRLGPRPGRPREVRGGWRNGRRERSSWIRMDQAVSLSSPPPTPSGKSWESERAARPGALTDRPSQCKQYKSTVRGIFATGRVRTLTGTGPSQSALRRTRACASENVFHENLFSKRNLSSSECLAISSVAQLFGLERYHHPESLNCEPLTLDYQKIFRVQREEYFNKLYGNQYLGDHVLQLTKQQKRPLVSEYLSDILTNEDTIPTSVECRDCGRTFPDPESLNFHRSLIHSNNKGAQSKSYFCRFCDQKFSYSLNRERHTYLVHPKESRRVN